MYCQNCSKLEAENTNLKRQLRAAGEFAMTQMDKLDKAQAECLDLRQKIMAIAHEPMVFDA